MRYGAFVMVRCEYVVFSPMIRNTGPSRGTPSAPPAVAVALRPAPWASRAAARAGPAIWPEDEASTTMPANAAARRIRPFMPNRLFLRLSALSADPGCQRNPPSVNSRAEIDDRGDGAAAVRPLVRRRHRDEHGGVAGHRGRHAAHAGLDLTVPVHVRVVEHGVAAPPNLAVLARLALEEDVHQPAAQVVRVRPVRQAEAGVLDGRPDPVGVQRVAHDRVPDPVPAADAAHVAGHDHLGAVEFDPG